MIDDCDSPDAQNVLTDDGRLEKRPGNEALTTIISGYAIKVAEEWTSGSGTRYLIAHATNTVYKTDFGSAATALSTVTAGERVEFAKGLGKVVFQDGTGTPWSFDGNSTTTVSGMPVGYYPIFADERFYIANIPSVSGSQVSVSSFGSINYFTVPSNVARIPDAPNSFTFQKDDGENVTCAIVTPWGKVFGKPSSMHILKGYDNSTYYKKIIDPKIGCIDNRSIKMVDGLLVWLARDGLYSWAGAGAPNLISRDINDLIKAIRQQSLQAAEWVLNSQADFEAGDGLVSGAGAPMSFTISPAAVQPTTWSFVHTSSTDFITHTLVNMSTNVSGFLYLSQASSGTFKNAGAEIGDSTNLDTLTAWTNAAGSAGYGSRYWSPVGAGESCDDAPSQYFHLKAINATTGVEFKRTSVNVANSQAFTDAEYTLDLSTIAAADIKLRADWGNNTAHVYISTPFIRPQSVKFRLRDACSGATCCPDFDIDESSRTLNGTSTTQVFDIGLATPTFGNMLVQMSTGSNNSATFFVRTATSASGAFGSYVAVTNVAQPAVEKRRFIEMRSEYVVTETTHPAPGIALVQLEAATSAYYYSPVHFIGDDITSFLRFDATDDLPEGSTITYSVRSATYSFPSSSAISWTGQTNHTTITVSASTPTYIQWRGLYEMTNGSRVPVTFRSAARWREGEDLPVAAGVVDHRFFFCAAFSSTSLTNDKCMVLQKNNKWIPWVGPVPGSLGIYDGNLIMGDGGTSGKVWKVMQDGVYNDDGDAIDAYWTTKEFSLGRPFQEKILHEVWLDGAFISTVTMSVGYSVNRSTTFTSKDFSTAAVPNVFNKRIPLAAGFAQGKHLALRFRNALLDQYFKVNAYLFYTELKDRKPE